MGILRFILNLLIGTLVLIVLVFGGLALLRRYAKKALPDWLKGDTGAPAAGGAPDPIPAADSAPMAEVIRPTLVQPHRGVDAVGKDDEATAQDAALAVQSSLFRPSDPERVAVIGALDELHTPTAFVVRPGGEVGGWV